ncbi:DUF4145 domain-containing protein [Pseudomonas cichorii]|nr:DUF4145 domain-containing protein [Pseudomonas cichorii]MBX8512186.1 DUF4145 domain-containing protein [Pseudomonas cichorii]MBX8527167.1 DUF4145 domain-containing protein [Pseudomonas cichorii]
MSWSYAQHIIPKTYICGFCTNQVASSSGFYSNLNQFIRICPNCEAPTYWGKDGVQLPGISPGRKVSHLPAELSQLYNEARLCAGHSAYTGSVLLCRKLLMNIGVQQGAEEGKSFVYYVEFLAAQGYVPPNGKHWVDHIRKKGNEATHEITFMTVDDASELITFSEMLLKFIYEFPNSISPATPQ